MTFFFLEDNEGTVWSNMPSKAGEGRESRASAAHHPHSGLLSLAFIQSASLLKGSLLEMADLALWKHRLPALGWTGKSASASAGQLVKCAFRAMKNRRDI